MLFSDAHGRKIVSTATAETVGKIDEFVIDPATQSVIAMTVKKADDGDTLRWSDIAAFGADAVTVSGADKVTEAGEDISAHTGKASHVLGKRILTTRGDEIGKVADVDFDPDTSSVLALIMGEGYVEGSKLVGVGSYAVVVHVG